MHLHESRCAAPVVQMTSTWSYPLWGNHNCRTCRGEVMIYIRIIGLRSAPREALRTLSSHLTASLHKSVIFAIIARSIAFFEIRLSVGRAHPHCGRSEQSLKNLRSLTRLLAYHPFTHARHLQFADPHC